jgi:hypothetical protein
MDFQAILQKLKKVGEASKEVRKNKRKTKEKSEYDNRFLKFYHHNQARLLKERKSLYYQKKEKGICVRCSRKVQEGIIFCDYHQQKQAGYNKQARAK